jgi:phosphoribosylglycinamide formyltransferase-1
LRFIALASGRGSNVAALIDAQRSGRLGTAQIAGLVVNRPGCGALAHADSADIPGRVVDHKAYASRSEFEEALLLALKPLKPDALVLAGFMRILTPYFLDRAPWPIVNLHPALLPAFPGANAIEEAFEAQVRVSGCSTHLVTAEVDGGPVLMQGVVPLQPDDTLDTFKERIHAMEHRVLPATLGALSQGHLRIAEGQVHSTPGFEPCLLK